MRHAWKCALLLAGCGGAGGIDAGNDASHVYSDGGGPFYSSDGGPDPVVRGAGLGFPAAWASTVAPTSPLVFSVYGATPSWDAIEAAVHVTLRPTGEVVTGTYTHAPKQFGGQDLTFVPDAPLPTLADVKVGFDTCPTCALTDASATGFSTGSHPRVVRVDATSKSDPGYYAKLGLSFSEPMDVDSVRAALSLDAGGAVPFTLDGGGDQRQMTITPSVAVAVTSYFTLTLGACKAASGTALDPASWDSPTETSAHTFSLTLDTAAAMKDGCGPGCLEWQPHVN